MSLFKPPGKTIRYEFEGASASLECRGFAPGSFPGHLWPSKLSPAAFVAMDHKAEKCERCGATRKVVRKR